MFDHDCRDVEPGDGSYHEPPPESVRSVEAALKDAQTVVLLLEARLRRMRERRAAGGD